MNLVSEEPLALKAPATLLDLSEVAKWLGVSAAWVREHATRKEPRLRAVKVGKLLRFRPEDVEEFLQRWTQ
jgi:excisionase family DNA binding protein